MLHRHPLLGIVTGVYLVFVGWMTLSPHPIDGGVNAWIWQALGLFSRHNATSWITYNDVEFTANMAMFLPVGLFLLLLFGRRQWWLAIILSFALSAGIELFQGAFLPTRVADIRDVISNTSGAIIGVLLGLVLTAGKARRLRLAARTA